MLTLAASPNYHIQNRFSLLERSLNSSPNPGRPPLHSAARALTRRPTILQPDHRCSVHKCLVNKTTHFM